MNFKDSYADQLSKPRTRFGETTFDHEMLLSDKIYFKKFLKIAYNRTILFYTQIKFKPITSLTSYEL
jgi:hypothetical protein